MTVYDARGRPRWFRPTLRLRLTILNGVLLVAGALVIVLLGWLVVGHAMSEAQALPPGTRLVNATTGVEVDYGEWRSGVLARARWEMLLAGLLAVALVGAAGVAGAYFVAGRALRPLQQVTTTARALTGDTLDQRIRYVGADDEVAELANTFDAMMDRISATFDSQKRFVANASHELRTPLTVMRTEVEVTLADPDADIEEYRRMAKVVRDGSERANALVESLLLLARTEAQSGRRLSKKVPADLADCVTSALSAMSREIDRIHLMVEQDLQPAPVVGDPGLLDRLAGNLIENAVRYNHLHGNIWVRTGGDDEHSWLVVRNTGFDVEPADVPRLFEPFRRGGRERTGGRGSGLGLSIVRAVADAHGGTVTATANPEGGLEVTLTLPSAKVTPVVP
ncbi:MAG: HAMP domain-containing histidine kinase, partial [Micromonosporaceae bacterium]|nr:HAMP domain-containing histidine kinase [Micromonosporaceae bacterium]